ncbi:MAG: hypothetical protein ACI8ZM_002664 [Crocinitomix sp.]|jgi:hypothetical protein
MHKQRLAVIIAAGIGVVSTFLPWISISFFGMSTSATGLSVWAGLLTLVVCAVAGVFAFLGDDRNQAIDSANVKFVAIAGGVGVLLVLLFVLANFSYVGSGAYIGLLATAAVAAVPFVIKDSGEFKMPTKDSIKDEFNEIKDN